MTIHVRLKFLSPGTFESNFRWLISSGTGAYEDLRGIRHWRRRSPKRRAHRHLHRANRNEQGRLTLRPFSKPAAKRAERLWILGVLPILTARTERRTMRRACLDVSNGQARRKANHVRGFLTHRAHERPKRYFDTPTGGLTWTRDRASVVSSAGRVAQVAHRQPHTSRCCGLSATPSPLYRCCRGTARFLNGLQRGGLTTMRFSIGRKGLWLGIAVVASPVCVATGAFAARKVRP